MQQALRLARKAADEGEIPVGALLVDRHQNILAQAMNRCESDHDPTAHAEILVIREACRKRGATRLPDCHLYVTLEPCPMCAQAIAYARLERVYFAAYDPKGGGIEQGAAIFSQPNCNHRPEIIGGMEETAASDLLKGFFQKKRHHQQ